MFYVHLFTFQLLIAAILSLYRMEVLLAKRQSIQMMSFTDVMKDSFCMVPRELHVRQMERGAKLQAIAKVNFSIESKVVPGLFPAASGCNQGIAAYIHEDKCILFWMCEKS